LLLFNKIKEELFLFSTKLKKNQKNRKHSKFAGDSVFSIQLRKKTEGEAQKNNKSLAIKLFS
jgi:hypothetical protein